MTTVGPERDDLRAVERRIARELTRLSAVRSLGGQFVGSPAYVRRHLAEGQRRRGGQVLLSLRYPLPEKPQQAPDAEQVELTKHHCMGRSSLDSEGFPDGWLDQVQRSGRDS